MLASHVDAHQLGLVFAAETGFILSRNPDTVRAPDVAFVTQGRIDALDDITGFVPLAPDLVAEVIYKRKGGQQLYVRCRHFQKQSFISTHYS